MKKSIYTLLAILAVAMLPGCGKSGAGSAGVYTSNASLNGSCYDILSIYQAGAGFTGTFQGSASYVDAGNVVGQMQGANISMPGVSYSRTNVAGDSIQIGYSGSTLYSYVTLAPATIQALAANNQRYICSLYVNSAVYNGVMQNSVYIYGAYGFTGLSI